MPNKVQISRNDFFSLIANETKGLFVHVKMRTDPSDVLKYSKEDRELNPYYKKIKKVTELNFRLLPDYEKRVKKNLVKEGKNPNDFSAEAMRGKKHVAPNSVGLVSEKDPNTKYIMLEFFKSSRPKVRFEYESNTIDKLMFEKWVSVKDSSNTKQNLDNEVFVRTPKLESIFQITYRGTVYELTD